MVDRLQTLQAGLLFKHADLAQAIVHMISDGKLIAETPVSDQSPPQKKRRLSAKKMNCEFANQQDGRGRGGVRGDEGSRGGIGREGLGRGEWLH